MKALLPPVRHALEQADVFRSGAVLLCAVSGGADSVALLHALAALRGEGGYTLLALHVQHGLRGEASLRDERFVRDLCARLRVPLTVEDAGLSGTMHDAGAETRARVGRRRIFLAQMERKRADALLLAHHLDDQAETVLMHMLRGAGMAGLCGMRPCAPFGRGVILRPWLGVSKQALMEALAREHLPYCEDESNFCALTPRNALRLGPLPQLNALFPRASEHIACLADSLAADEACLSDQADALYAAMLVDAAPLFALRRAPLLNAHEALVRRVLRRWVLAGLALTGPLPDERALSHRDTLALLCALRTGEGCNLPCGLRVQAGPQLLHLLAQTGAPLVPLPAFPPVPVTARADGYALRDVAIAQECAVGAPPADACCAILTPEVLAQSPVWRLPHADDRIRPLGASGAKPLRRYLTDRKVDPLLRPLLPVLAIGSDILWIPSLVTAEALRVTRVSGGCVRLRLTDGGACFSHQSKE